MISPVAFARASDKLRKLDVRMRRLRAFIAETKQSIPLMQEKTKTASYENSSSTSFLLGSPRVEGTLLTSRTRATVVQRRRLALADNDRSEDTAVQAGVRAGEENGEGEPLQILRITSPNTEEPRGPFAFKKKKSRGFFIPTQREVQEYTRRVQQADSGGY
ncbi:unnamed protein product [Amoebophrya sp. A25]|nr:unnamed protein product [Amoebophrya sp. A25]|eukprot:GSA25T00016447001.1